MVRITGSVGSHAVVCADGGSGHDVPGNWSASLEWLVERLVPRFPGLAFVEVCYRIKSWNRLGMCIEDVRAALVAARAHGATELALVGFSMGGAVAIGAAAASGVSTVIGLAPWIPDRLPVSGLDGRRLAVLHGSLDRYLPGIPGVSPANSRRGYERARARGVEATYTLIPGALHGLAVRAPWGGVLALPRGRRWAGLVALELERFQGPR